MDHGESEADRNERLRHLWSQLDTKKRGALDLPALKAGLTRMQHPLKDADGLIREMLSACDINHDGQISYEEFVRFCKETEQELWTLFQSIDRDHNGNLDKRELKIAFDRAGVAVSNTRLDRFFDYIDKNHDGVIDFSEWRDFLLFLPMHAPGMRAVLSFYASTGKVTAEGDVHINDEALQGLGTTLDFLKHTLFGAILLIAQPPALHRYRKNYVVGEEQGIEGYASFNLRPTFTPDLKSFEQGHEEDVNVEDPLISVKPARRKEDQLKLTDFLPDLGYFVAGGVSGITSRTATAPLDRLKVYLIAQTASASEAVEAAKSGAALQATRHGLATMGNAFKDLWAAGGIRSLFAGNGINIVKVMPESAVKFGSYEACKRAIAKWEGHNDPRRISSWSTFLAGGVAGMIAQAVVYPLDTLKFRMQCETVPGGEHGNRLLWHTAQKMWRQDGVRSFYRGLPMGLVGMFPYAAIDLFIFESIKKAVVRRNMKRRGLKHEEDAMPRNFTLALMGGFSGALGASVVYPINLLRTRLQSQGTAGHPRTYTGIVDVTRQTLKGEGVRGLFKGLTPNLLKVVPAVSITYVVYENTKKWLHLH